VQLATSLARALDPVRLAVAAGIDPDPWQSEVLRSRVRQILMLCTRQGGKSLVSGLLAVDEALHRAPALILLLAPALRQSQELFRKIRDLLAALGEDVPRYSQQSALSLELANGSRLVCLPGQKDQTIRGFSAVSLLVVDEAARVSDLLYNSVRPMLAVSGGRIVLLSTPWGRRGFLFEEYTNGGPEWQKIRITADQCPRIDPVWLERERQQVPHWVFRQEYGCEFVETEDQVFAYDLVTRAVSSDVAPLFPRGQVAA
jgi:terminase large subunit-like protein